MLNRKSNGTTFGLSAPREKANDNTRSAIEYFINFSAQQFKTLARANAVWIDALLISLVFNSYCCSVFKLTLDLSASSF